MKYVDIHCHLPARHDSAVGELGGDFINQGNLREILLHMREQEVGAINIGADLESSKKAVEIAEQNENIWACIGVHPEGISPKSYGASPEASLNVREVETNSPGELFKEEEFEKLIKNPKVVGVGECGLDYFRLEPAFAKVTAAKQKDLFESQIQFALKHDKPLMLHIRSSEKNNLDAYEDVLEILAKYKKEFGDKLRGNVHFFAGNVEIAKKFLDLGFTMSFTGVITFTQDYDEVIKFLPQDSIMSETDAPFVAPVPHRGQRCEPVYIIEVVKKMAEIRGEDADVLNKTIIYNSKRLFNIF